MQAFRQHSTHLCVTCSLKYEFNGMIGCDLPDAHYSPPALMATDELSLLCFISLCTRNTLVQFRYRDTHPSSARLAVAQRALGGLS